MSDQDLLDYFDDTPDKYPASQFIHMTCEEWEDARLEYARLAMRRSVAQFAEICRRWLAEHGEGE